MSETSTQRMRRPSWRDPRLGVGVLLVAGSVALGAWAVSSADSSVDVYQARVAMTPGDVVEADDLQVVQVRLDDVEAIYLVPGSDLVPGSVVTRTVAAGELVPLASLGSATDIDVRPVQVPMSAAMQDVVGKGSVVDLWVAMPEPGSAQGDLLPPELLVSDVAVRDVHASSSVFVGSDQVEIQVLVPEADLSAVLAAITADGVIQVVPQLGGGVG